jgi:enoyl-CoA hydratase/carnithine racemase
MAAETWFNAEEAKEAGFADRVVAENENGGNHWNLSAYAKVPQALRDRKPPRAPQPAYDRATLDRRLAMFEKRIAA